MIESCTKKRMLLAFSLLGGLTILVLIVESHWTNNTGDKSFAESFETNSSCTSGEEYQVVSECHPCTAFEIASESIGVCVRARYKEVVRCENGETITRSCDRVAWLEERAFWRFQGLVFASAAVSCACVFWREGVTRRRLVRRVARRLAGEV